MGQALKAGTRIKKTPYDVDLTAWVAEQVALLRAGRLDEIDADNIAEELEDVGREQYDTLESALTVLIMHLLKWDHQPDRRSRSWRGTIAEQPRRIQTLLKKNPSLKASLAEAIGDGFVDGRGRAAVEMDIDEDALPAECPYGFDEIMTRPVERDPPAKGR
jgi:Domain of unknown function DUF29